MNKLPAHTLLTALRGYYAPAATGDVTLDTATLIERLHKLPSLSAQPHNDSIMGQLGRHYAGLQLTVADQAVILFVDDVLSGILKKIDMEFRIEAMIRNLAPLIAAEALSGDLHALRQPLKIFQVLDILIQECVGWSEDLGILGERHIEQIEAALLPLLRGKITAEECTRELKEALRSEHHRQGKLEENLMAAEQQRLEADSARHAAAEMLNQEMAAQPLPLFIIFMLQGAWYEFIQNIYRHHSQTSEQWQAVSSLTKQLIWSLQPQPEAAKQQQLFHSLPKDILAFAEAQPFDTADVTQCLADVEAEYEAISDNQPSPPCDFDPLESSDNSEVHGELSDSMLADLKNTPAGSWYLYDDKQESDEKIARVKLIINSPSAARMVFTNQNRRKVMYMTYLEFAARLSSNTVKSLVLSAPLQQLFCEHLSHIITTIKAQKAKELQEEKAEQRKQLSRDFLANQQVLISDEMQRLKQRAALKQKRAKLLREKVQKKLKSANDAVDKLRPDAWVKLPLMEGTQTACKLVAVVSAADKYIFANRAGIKVAEYTAGQLSHMIVTENSEILDTGAEFENVLATVVSGLRENKSKSFDQLTGVDGGSY